MASQWDAWERALRAGGKWADLSSAPATRGLKWAEPIEIEGDWTGAALEGSVRSAPDAGSTLASFTITGPVVADGWSVWQASLASGSGSNSTGVLPADNDMDGVEYFPCMFRLTPSGGDKDTLIGGLLPVVGQV